MSAIALVLISTEPGQEQQVVADLKEMREVSEAMVLFGEYDVYCKVVVDNFSRLSVVVRPSHLPKFISVNSFEV